MMHDFWVIKRNRQNLLSCWTIFCPFTPLNQKIKILKIQKDTWRYHYFTQLHHKWQSYDVWFLRYAVQQTEFFVILGHFSPFYPTNPKNQNFEEKKKKHLEISSFYLSVPKIMIKCYTVPETWHIMDVIVIFHFGLFFALLPPRQSEKSKLKKKRWKKPLQYGVWWM